MSKRPATSGYARIAQIEDEEEDLRNSNDSDEAFSDHDQPISLREEQYASSQPKRPQLYMRMQQDDGVKSWRSKRNSANSGIDIKAINARFERWAEEIKDKFTRLRVKGASADQERLEIHYSVFQAPDWIRPASREELDAEVAVSGERISKLEFDDLIESVRTAIELGVHPKLIAQGSSGSYFARNSKGKVVGVFKPKDEEPYANKNPKWTKWLHRNLLPFAFGRAMLIPNLSYVSEAAAYVLDCQLRSHIVPYTDVVNLSSKSFHYDWMDRRAYYRKKRPFPEKPGSFQVFLKGYKGATDFFQDHPWPDQQGATVPNVKAGNQSPRGWTDSCMPRGGHNGDTEVEADGLLYDDGRRSRSEFWNPELQQDFREELEKLVILDYIMRNTDRGTDNWMIRIDRPAASTDSDKHDRTASHNGQTDEEYTRREETMSTAPREADHNRAIPRIGAIDNSLSWPWKHPDAWRSYPFGWLFLPVSLIGRPVSARTREHFLPLLTSREWWSETIALLRRCFEIDADFQEKMFARQMAVMKGQAWNVVETLKQSDHGPLELTRRNRVMVWDDIVEVPVAVSSPQTTAEVRRQTAEARKSGEQSKRVWRGLDEEDGMDISAALSESAPLDTPQRSQALNSNAGPSHDNPFNSARDDNPHIHSADEDGPTQGDTTAPSTSLENKILGIANAAVSAVRPKPRRHRTAASRNSYDMSSAQWQTRASARPRRFSYSMRAKSSTDPDLGDDGDLGYAAAATQESSTRRVIVERLEVVKSKQPFFSWC
jgi:hypothetical protein